MPTPVANRSTYLKAKTTHILANPGYRILDLSPLYGMAMRGSVETLPYVAGGEGYQHRVDARSVVLPMLVVGQFQSDGTPVSNIYEGLDDNVDEILSNVVLPGTTAYRWYWHRATGGTDLQADVFVEQFTPQAWGRGWVRFGLGLVIPAGRFA